MEEMYKALIFITAKDFRRVESNYSCLRRNLPANELIFVGNDEVGSLVSELGLKNVCFINEEQILPFENVDRIMREALGVQSVPRGLTGWYYQQFLKMQYSACCKDDYYLVWDGDTIPCKKISMFHENSGIPYFDLKSEYNEEYFITIRKILPGMDKCIKKSFISEHMLMRTDIMRHMITDIENNNSIKGNTFFEKIIYSIPKDKLSSNSFSEFETYGTYTCFKYLNSYRLRDWHSFRYAGYFFDVNTISDEDYMWLSRDFDAISFEKNHELKEGFDEIFNKKEYREKLSARQILEAIQPTFENGLLEVWD